MATRRKLIKKHGQHWHIWLVGYRDDHRQFPCVDCGNQTITHAEGNVEEPLCSNCAAWRLGAVEGKREARESLAPNREIAEAIKRANERQSAADAIAQAAEGETHGNA